MVLVRRWCWPTFPRLGPPGCWPKKLSPQCQIGNPLPTSPHMYVNLNPQRQKNGILVVYETTMDIYTVVSHIFSSTPVPIFLIASFFDRLFSIAYFPFSRSRTGRLQSLAARDLTGKQQRSSIDLSRRSEKPPQRSHLLIQKPRNLSNSSSFSHYLYVPFVFCICIFFKDLWFWF